MEVVFVPYWGQHNPYQDALGKSLESLDIKLRKDKFNSIFRDIIFCRYKVDILHLHWLPPFKRNSKTILFLFKLCILRIIGIKLVWTVHNLRPHESVSLKSDWLIAKFVTALANAIIVHGSTAKEEVVSAFNLKNNKKIFVIPHGNFIDQYKNTVDSTSARARLNIADSKLVLLFLGKIRPYKGVLQLIDAFKTLKADELNVELIIAGSPSNDDFSNTLKLKIAGVKGIRYKPGFVPQNEIQLYMNACDVAVFPYQQILTSGSVILAMSFARACVAPKLGCIRDILDDKGAFLYDPQEKNALLNALKAACANRENLQKMGRHNWQKVLSWTWDYIAAETLKVYQKCLNE